MSIQRASKPAPSGYLIDGIEYPRVSQIIGVLAKPGLDAWRRKVGFEESDRVSKTAREFGTRLHAALEQACLEFQRASVYVVPVSDGDLEQQVRALQDWLEAQVYEVIATERQVCSRKFGYAGTADALIRDRAGRLVLLDFKSDKLGPWTKHKPEHAAQLAAYRLALAEDGLIVDRRLILQLPKNEPGRLVEWEYADHRTDTLAFLRCLALWKWLKSFEGRRP